VVLNGRKIFYHISSSFSPDSHIFNTQSFYILKNNEAAWWKKHNIMQNKRVLPGVVCLLEWIAKSFRLSKLSLVKQKAKTHLSLRRNYLMHTHSFYGRAPLACFSVDEFPLCDNHCLWLRFLMHTRKREEKQNSRRTLRERSFCQTAQKHCSFVPRINHLIRA